MFDKLAQKCLKIERGWRMEESNKLGHSSMGKVQVGGWGRGGGWGLFVVLPTGEKNRFLANIP